MESDREAVVAPVEGEGRARMRIMAGRTRKRKNRSFGREEDGLEADGGGSLCGDDEEDIQRAVRRTGEPYCELQRMMSLSVCTLLETHTTSNDN